MSRTLGPLAPRSCYCLRPRKTPHRGVFAGNSITRRKPSTFFFYRKKKVAKKNAPSGKMRKVFRPLRRATRAPPWTCRPLKRAALNFRPFVTQWLSWVLPGVLTVFCPKRKIAPRNLARGVTTSRLLLHPTPGTTQASVQPLGAERRGGSGGCVGFLICVIIEI